MEVLNLRWMMDVRFRVPYNQQVLVYVDALLILAKHAGVPTDTEDSTSVEDGAQSSTKPLPPCKGVHVEQDENSRVRAGTTI